MATPAATAAFPPSPIPQYDHTQRSPIPWLIVLPAAAILVGVILAFRDVPTTMAGLTIAVVLAVIAFAFHWLRITDDADALVLRFGPVPLFRKRIPYATIAAATADKTSLIDGIGIHFFPGRGWTYNIWGFNCVRLTLVDGSTLRIGSDGPAGLARFLQQKCSPRA